MRIGVLTDKPCIFNGGFSQRVLREIDLLAEVSDSEVYYYTFFSLSTFRSVKETPDLSSEKSISQATKKVMNSHNIKDINAKFIISSRIKRALPSDLYDRIYARKVAKYVRRNHIDVLLCENLWCAYIGYIVSKSTGIKYVFDYHGAVPEEHKFFKNEKEDWAYHYFKQIEKDALLNANHIICVSNFFKKYIVKEFDMQPCKIDVVPCCVSEFQYYSEEVRNEMRRKLNLKDRKVIIYSGSITKYQCVQEMSFLFSELIKRDRSFYFLFLSAYSDYDIVDRLMKEYNVPVESYMLKSVPQKEVHKYLCLADYALIIREDHILNQVASPTKIAEYLMAGLPIIGTNCIGDITDIPSAKILFDFAELKNSVNEVVDNIVRLDRNIVDRGTNSQVAMSYVQSKLTWQSYKQLYVAILSSLSNS